MASIEDETPAATFGDLIQVSNSNNGVDATMRNVSDGKATDSGLGLSSSQVGVVDGAVGAPGVAFRSDLDNGLYRIGANNWAMSVAGAKALEFNSIGAVLMPLQPAFLAYNSVDDANQTGNGAVATVDFDTEVFDQNNDFASDTFTAPVTGRYLLAAAVRLKNFGAGANAGQMDIVTTARTYRTALDNLPVTDLNVTYTLSVVADMAATNTAVVRVVVSGMSGDTVTITGGSTLATFFSGHLVA